MFWNVKIPSRSYWVPFDVTVKLSVTAAQEPAAPQVVGGLETHEHRHETLADIKYPRVLNNFWTTIQPSQLNFGKISLVIEQLTPRMSSRTCA